MNKKYKAYRFLKMFPNIREF